MNDEPNRDYILVVDEEYEEYCGPTSVGWFLVLSFICPLAAIFVPCCPCDKRKKNQVHVVV